MSVRLYKIKDENIKDLDPDKAKFIDMRAQGLSYDKIAKELHKSKSTLIDWNKELGSHIAERKAIELEALLEQYRLLIENRIETTGIILKKIVKEIEDRDLKKIGTDRLYELYIKYMAFIKELLPDRTGKTTEDRTSTERPTFDLQFTEYSQADLDRMTAQRRGKEKEYLEIRNKLLSEAGLLDWEPGIDNQ